jgi:endonuclease III
MPNKKAGWLVENFDRVTQLGGPELAKAELMKCKGCDEKIQFWRDFRGIGEKYARNIMMDVYHPDFRNTIAVDARIKRISRKLGLTFPNYKEEEWFYLAAAKRAGIEGWELDRMLYGSPALANSRADTLEHSKP